MFLAVAVFFVTDILQDDVASRLTCGGKLYYQFVENLRLNLLVKEF